MLTLVETEVFKKWRARLRDRRVRVLIASRLDAMAFGHFGDCRAVGAGISELRIHHGPGYRIYFQSRGDKIILLLCGGDKDRQDKDIARAKLLAKEWSAQDD